MLSSTIGLLAQMRPANAPSAPPPAPPTRPRVAPAMTAPADRTIVPVGTVTTVTVRAPDDTAVAIHDRTRKLGDAVDAGEGVFTFAWAPAAPDDAIALTAVGDAAGSSAAVRILADATGTRVPASVASWQKNNKAVVTTGMADPFGGTSACKVAASGTFTSPTSIQLSAVPSPAMTRADCGLEFWARPGEMTAIAFHSGGQNQCQLDLVTGESDGNGAVATVVEARADGWRRIWITRENASSPPPYVRLYPVAGLGGTGTLANAGDGLFLHDVRMVDGPLPFALAERTRARRIAVDAATGVETYKWRNSRVDEPSTAIDAQRIDVLKPAGWTADGTYPVVYALTALPNEADKAMAAFRAAKVVETYGVVVVAIGFGSSSWYGRRADGTFDEHAFAAQALPAFARAFCGGVADPEKNLLVGYSKAGNAAVSLLLRNRETFGYAAAWDGYWNARVDTVTATNPDYGQAEDFTTQMDFERYNPVDILAARRAAVADKARLVLTGWAFDDGNGATFRDDQIDMKAALDLAAIAYAYDATQRGNHAWSSGWLAGTVAEMMAQAGIPPR